MQHALGAPHSTRLRASLERGFFFAAGVHSPRVGTNVGPGTKSPTLTMSRIPSLKAVFPLIPTIRMTKPQVLARQSQGIPEEELALDAEGRGWLKARPFKTRRPAITSFAGPACSPFPDDAEGEEESFGPNP
jgi:hypothetical protein